MVYLASEEGRSVFAENFDIGDETGPTCKTLCLKVLLKYLNEHPGQIGGISNMLCTERELLVELLSLDLPLQIVLDYIEDDSYWMRYTLHRWPEVLVDPSREGNWRIYYLQRHISELISSQVPEHYDTEELQEKCMQVADYIYDLDIEEMIPSRPTTLNEDDPDEDATVYYPADHFNLRLVLPCLPKLRSLKIKYGAKKLGDTFEWYKLNVSVEDGRKLGQGILELPSLKKLVLHRSSIGDAEIKPILQALIKYDPLEELEISYCLLNDQSGLMLGKFLSVHPNLKALRVPGNNIGVEGIRGISYGLKEGNCPLDYLDIRLNPIGEDGMLSLLSGLVRTRKPKYLCVAGVNVCGDGGIGIAKAMQYQPSIQILDVSSNYLGPEGGQFLVTSVRENITLTEIDCRNTGVMASQIDTIEEYLTHNRKRGSRKVSSFQCNPIISREFSFPDTESEIMLQREKEKQWARLMAEEGELSSDDMEVVIIKEFNGANQEEEDEYISGFGDSSTRSRSQVKTLSSKWSPNTY